MQTTNFDLAGFTDDMLPMQKSRVITAMQRSVSNNGRYISRYNLVHEWINDNAIVIQASTERRLIKEKTGVYLAESQISKTAMDYAVFLITLREEKNERAAWLDEKKANDQ